MEKAIGYSVVYLKRIIREDYQNNLVNKGEISYNKLSTCKKRR